MGLSNDNDFILKHRNAAVAEMSIDLLDGSIRKISIVNQELLPPGGNLSIEDLRRWWMRRAVPLLCGNIQKVLEESQVVNTQSLLLKNFGISLSDHYWFCPTGCGLSWEQVNPYNNEFRDLLGEMQFCPSGHFGYMGSSFVPGFSLQGS